MTSALCRICLLALVSFVVITEATAQRPRPAKPRPKPVVENIPEPAASPEVVNEPQDIETLKIATDLVLVPVIATEPNGLYASNLKKDEFEVWEDAVKQEIAFFSSVSAPFHVVLMLDTSASTLESLRDIKRAAIAFTDQLQRHDQVLVIAFNDLVTELNQFTSDKATLRDAINNSQAGEGTKLYDAFSVALDSLRTISGRKAIVLFSDGVDRISDRATFDSTLRGLDEEGVIVYPIRYDTRAATERLVRQQAEEQSSLPTLDVIRAPRGKTAPTFPSDEPDPVPNIPRGRTGPLGLPLPEEIMRRRREDRDRRDRERDGRARYPDNLPTSEPPRDPRDIPGASSDPDPIRTRRRSDDGIDAMLDLAYNTADSYLKQLETKSGGRLVRADTIASLPDAFVRIAAELRTQYALGYYPTNKTKDGKYRRIKIATTRKGLMVRSRPGYVPAGD